MMAFQRILFTGVGGQGTLLASRLLGETMMEEGFPVRVSEVHGMAQRGGVVESTVMLGGLEGPIISNGEADILVSFEPLETLRALPKCHEGTWIISNIIPIQPFTVRLGQSGYPDPGKWIAFIKQLFKNTVAFNAESLARQAGTTRAVNIVLLGALIGCGAIPVSPEHLKRNIKEKIKPKFVDANLKAFELGLAQVTK